jgi:hypothetical protein
MTEANLTTGVYPSSGWTTRAWRSLSAGAKLSEKCTTGEAEMQ